MEGFPVTGGAAACAAEATKRRKHERSGAGACAFVPLAPEADGLAGVTTWWFMHRLATAATPSGAVCRISFHVHAMQHILTMLCRGATWQVRASAPLMGPLAVRFVLAGMVAPTNDLLSHVGHEQWQMCPSYGRASTVSGVLSSMMIEVSYLLKCAASLMTGPLLALFLGAEVCCVPFLVVLLWARGREFFWVSVFGCAPVVCGGRRQV